MGSQPSRFLFEVHTVRLADHRLIHQMSDYGKNISVSKFLNLGFMYVID